MKTADRVTEVQPMKGDGDPDDEDGRCQPMKGDGDPADASKRIPTDRRYWGSTVKRQESLDRRRYCKTMHVELVEGGQICFRLLYESFYLDKFVSLVTDIVLRRNRLGLGVLSLGYK